MKCSPAEMCHRSGTAQFFDRIASPLVKSADDTKLGRDASASEDRIRIQNDHDKLEKGSEINKIKFNRGKCKCFI